MPPEEVEFSPPPPSTNGSPAADIAIGVAQVGVSLIPGGPGEAMDLYTLGAPDSTLLDRGLSAVSLIASVFSGTLLPNFGGWLKGGRKAAGGISDAAKGTDKSTDIGTKFTKNLPGNTGNWRASSRTGKDKTILGRGKDDYKGMADKEVANKFYIPDEQWDAMSEAERWAANQEFLDDCIANGSSFDFATHSSGYWEAGYNGGPNYFAMEIDYLLSQGYKLKPDGFGMVK